MSKLFKDSDHCVDLKNDIYNLKRKMEKSREGGSIDNIISNRDNDNNNTNNSENEIVTENFGTFKEHISRIPLHLKDNDPLAHVDAARITWENSINEELVAISKERGEPLCTE